MVIFLADKNDKYVIECRDHASGSRIACAGVSSLTSSLLGWLENFKNVNTKVHKSELVPGYAYFEFEGGSEAATVFNFVYIGLRQIALSYPDSVHIDDHTGHVIKEGHGPLNRDF